MTEDIFQLGVKALIIERRSGEILLLEVNVASFAGQTEAYWDIPGGRVQRGDTVMRTLEREVGEETGIEELEEPRLFTTTVANIRIPYQNTDTGLILQVYTVAMYERPAVQLSGEHTGYEWVSVETAAARLQTKYPATFLEQLKSSTLV